MLCSRVLSRISRTGLNRCREILLSPQPAQTLVLSHEFHDSSNKKVPSQMDLLKHLGPGKQLSQRFGFSSSAPPRSAEKDGEDTTVNVEYENESSDADADADADSFENLSNDQLVQLVKENKELVELKNKEMEKMQDKFLRSYAEMENIMGRTKRDAENSKKFAVQNFAKSLLDVADNLGRASSVVKESFSKIDTSKDTSGAVPLLKTLLEGVDMTDKQLSEVFRKFGVEKYDPVNEQFDPHLHNAVFQIPDGSKAPGIIAAVLKPGYMLYDRVIRPAEVGVTKEIEAE